MRPPLLALSLLIALTPSCAYLSHRAQDAAQTLHLGVGTAWPPGLLVHASVPVFGTTAGYLRDGRYVGTDYGYTVAWREAGIGYVIGGALARAEPAYSVEGVALGTAEDVYLYQSQFFMLGLSVTDHRTAFSDGALALSRVEAGVHALVLGVSVGVDLVELLDFVAGIVGLDPTGDDGFVPSRAPFARFPTDDEEPAESGPDDGPRSGEEPATADETAAPPPEDEP